MPSFPSIAGRINNNSFVSSTTTHFSSKIEPIPQPSRHRRPREPGPIHTHTRARVHQRNHIPREPRLSSHPMIGLGLSVRGRIRARLALGDPKIYGQPGGKLRSHLDRRRQRWPATRYSPAVNGGIYNLIKARRLAPRSVTWPPRDRDWSAWWSTCTLLGPSPTDVAPLMLRAALRASSRRHRARTACRSRVLFFFRRFFERRAAYTRSGRVGLAGGEATGNENSILRESKLCWGWLNYCLCARKRTPVWLSFGF